MEEQDVPPRVSPSRLRTTIVTMPRAATIATSGTTATATPYRRLDPSRKPTGAPCAAPMISPSHITRRPRTKVPTGQPLTRHAVVGRPAAARLAIQRVGDRLRALQVDDREVGVVADGDAALAADAEQPLRPVRCQVDEALERQPAGIDVVEHDGNQRLHAGHAGVRARDRRDPSPRACAARGRSRARRRCPRRAPPKSLRGGGRRAPAGSSARRCRAARSSRARPASGDAASPRRSPSPCASARNAISSAVETCSTCTRRLCFSASRTSRRVAIIAASSSRHSGCEDGSPGRRVHALFEPRLVLGMERGAPRQSAR